MHEPSVLRPISDEQLHASIIVGDSTAMGLWQERHRRTVLRRLLRPREDGARLSAEEADEAWNDIFRSTIQRAPSLVPPGESLIRYAMGAADRARAMCFRARRIRLSALSLERYWSETLGDYRLPVTRVEASDRSARALADVLRLRECLARAPESHRMVAKALMSTGSVAEIADVRSVKVASAYQSKRRALAWLRQCIEAKRRTGA